MTDHSYCLSFIPTPTCTPNANSGSAATYAESTVFTQLRFDFGSGPFVPWHAYCEWKVSLDSSTKYEIVITRTYFNEDREQMEIDVVNALGIAVTYADSDLKAATQSLINVENAASFVIRALNGPQNYTLETYQV